jgi:chaperonin GroEL
MNEIQIPALVQGFQPIKELYFDEEGREKLRLGINKIARAVASTLGGRGNTVIIESSEHTHGLTVTKDGYSVARSIELSDSIENLAVRIMKQAAERTLTASGDGTSSSIVLAEALIEAGFKYITPEVNRIEVLRELANLTEEVVSQLNKKKRKATKPLLRSVATIACNNDPKIGKIVADGYISIGKNGFVTAEKSKTTETYSETTTGLRLRRGWTSPYFVNNQEREECIFEDVYILVCDTEIDNISQIVNILDYLYSKNKSLLMIAPCTNQAVATLSVNKLKKGLQVCNIQPPEFGYRQNELMSDIAISTGAKYFSEKTGDLMQNIVPADLGHAKRIVVGQHETIIIKDDGENPEVEKRIEELTSAMNNSTKKNEKDFLRERIASLTGGVTIVYAGGNTDLEQKELFDRIDDAVCAVRSALEEGVVAGGGVALFDIQLKESNLDNYNIAVKIMDVALKAPMIQILKNGGVDFTTLPYFNGRNRDIGSGYDVKTGNFGSMVDMGIIDPLKVCRCALENACSVAVTILSTNCIVTLARSYENR